MAEYTALPAARQAYLEWLLSPASERVPESKMAYAEAAGVHVKTLYLWEKNKDFRREWNRQVDIIQESPERRAQMLDLLFQDGMRGDKKSIELFFKLTNQIQPPTIKVEHVDKKVTELSDEDLSALLAQEAGAELAARQMATVV